uniref:CSD domain-containing protein n=1 Tax=Alexandrium monilatum TaxID=311494 RepID=A0A7S4Q0I4_9DINO
MAAAGAEGVERWLASVHGLDPETVRRAGELFVGRNVDAHLLDFLASEGGSSILSAWRSRGPAASGCDASAAGMSAGAAAAAAGEAATAGSGGAPTSAASAGPAGPKEAAASAPKGRQRIPAADRRLGSHYFVPAPTRPEAHGRHVRAKEKATEKQPSVPHAKADVNTAGSRGPFYATAPSGPLASAAVVPRASSLKSEGSQERLLGTLKSFSDDTGYGFIHCEHVQQDIFLCAAERPEDGRLDTGRLVEFTLVYDSLRRPKARNTIWLPPVAAGRFCGRIKSVGSEYGFIACKRTFNLYHRDVYFATAQLPAGDWEPSQLVSFDVSINSRGQPQAKCLLREEPGFETSSDSGSDSSSALPRDSCGWAAPRVPAVTHW